MEVNIAKEWRKVHSQPTVSTSFHTYWIRRILAPSRLIARIPISDLLEFRVLRVQGSRFGVKIEVI